MMLKFNNEKELLSYLIKRMEEEKTFETCKECSSKGDNCCSHFNIENDKPEGCRFLTKDGCSNRNVRCSLTMCTKLQAKHPLLSAEFKKIKEALKYIQLIKFPMEVKW